jgi:hypothetical protein
LPNGGQIANSYFAYNESVSNGGAIYLGNSSRIYQSQFIGNQADNGGAIYSSENELYTENNLFARNQVTNTGSAIYFAGQGTSTPVLSLIHATIADVTTNGQAAVVVADQTAYLTNTIIANHTTGITATAGTIVTYDYNLFYGNTQDTGGAGTFNDGGHNLNGEPDFVDAANDNYRLGSSSAAIDAGNNSLCASEDIRGEARNDLACDAGAYEFTATDGMSVTHSINGLSTYTFGPTLVAAEVTNDGGCLSSLTVEEVTGNHPQAPEGLQTGKYWNITPTGCSSGFTVTLTLPHSDSISADEARACRYDGSTWDCGDGNNNDSVSNRVTRTNVTQFSPWAAGNAALPLAVNLASFVAEGDFDQVHIEWQTVSERNNLGFNLYRGTTASLPELGGTEGGLMQLNPSLSPAQAPGSGQGAAYEFVDQQVEDGTTYYYWLEDVDVNGSTTLHGPVSATINTPTAISLNGLTINMPTISVWMLIWLMLILLMGGRALLHRI